MRVNVELRHVDQERDMNTTIEHHECPDVDRALKLIRVMLEAGLTGGQWIEVTPAWAQEVS